MKNNRRIWFLIGILVIAIIVGGIFYYFSNRGEECEYGTYKLYDNVIDVTGDSDIQIQSLKDGMMSYSGKKELKKGDVIVAGVTEATPNGGIWIIEETPKQSDGTYYVKVVNGTLLDVFEQANINASFNIKNDGTTAKKTDEESIVEDMLSVNEVHAEGVNGELSDVFGREFEEKINDHTTFSGEAKCTLILKFKLIIKNGNIELELTVTDKLSGELKLDCKANSEKEFEMELFEKELKPIQFTIGPVPVVISNELGMNVQGSVGIEGDICTKVGVSKTNTAGFNYNSKTGKIKEILEDNYDSDGMNWIVTESVTAKCTMGANLYFQAKLYGVVGIDVTPGIEGDVTGELLCKESKKKATLVGKVDAEVYPVASGNLIVDNPIVDENLVTQKLFDKEFKPLWEKHWKSSASWEDEIKKEKKKQSGSLTKKYKDYLKQQQILTGKEYGTYLVRYELPWGDYAGDVFYNGIVASVIDDFDVNGESELITIRSDEEGNLKLSLDRYDKKEKKVNSKQQVDLQPIPTAANAYSAHWSVIGIDKKYILYDYDIGYSAISDGYFRGFALYEIKENSLTEIAKYYFGGSSWEPEETVEFDAEIEKVFNTVGKQCDDEQMWEIEKSVNFSDYIDCDTFGKIQTTEDISHEEIYAWQESGGEPLKIRIATGHIY